MIMLTACKAALSWTAARFAYVWHMVLKVALIVPAFAARRRLKRKQLAAANNPADAAMCALHASWTPCNLVALSAKFTYWAPQISVVNMHPRTPVQNPITLPLLCEKQ